MPLLSPKLSRGMMDQNTAVLPRSLSCLMRSTRSQKETEEEEEFLREQARYEQEARDAQEKF